MLAAEQGGLEPMNSACKCIAGVWVHAGLRCEPKGQIWMDCTRMGNRVLCSEALEVIEITCHLHCRKVERTLDIDVNQRDRFGRTALMWAAEQGHVAAIETLLDLGSDRTIRDPHTNR